MKHIIRILILSILTGCTNSKFDYNQCNDLKCSLVLKIKKISERGLSAKQVCDSIEGTEVIIVSHKTGEYNFGAYTCQLNKDVLDFDTVSQVYNSKSLKKQ